MIQRSCFILLLIVILAFTGCMQEPKSAKLEESDTSSIADNARIDVEIESVAEEPEPVEVPVFVTDNLANLKKQTSVETSYITDRLTCSNHFYIDEDGFLWGTGKDDWGQLGIGVPEDIGDSMVEYKEPVMIAENVIHVDVSDNEYFTIFLTADHKLYGMGVNRMGVLLEEEISSHDAPWRGIVISPKLLMEDVAYASAGMESISVLTTDGKVYWWGQFQATTGTNQYGSMQSYTPQLMVEDAVYTVCGNFTAGAVDKQGKLWLWGCNVWGQCGIDGPDYVTEAVKACDDVEMVWIGYFSSRQNVFDTVEWDGRNALGWTTDYSYNTFVRKTDGKMYACGEGILGNKKSVDHYGDVTKKDAEESGMDTSKYDQSYNVEFVLIEVEEYK